MWFVKFTYAHTHTHTHTHIFAVSDAAVRTSALNRPRRYGFALCARRIRLGRYYEIIAVYTCGCQFIRDSTKLLVYYELFLRTVPIGLRFSFYVDHNCILSGGNFNNINGNADDVQQSVMRECIEYRPMLLISSP